MIARQGSFSRAAEHAKLSQPALSRTIAQLERTVGARVLERGRFGARLNELGIALVRHAEAVEVQLSRAREDAALHREKLGGTLIVGVTPITAAVIVPTAVSRLAERRPGVLIRILELPFERGRAALKRGEIDLYVGPLQQLGEPTDFSEETIVADPLCVVVASSAPAGSAAFAHARENSAAWLGSSDRVQCAGTTASGPVPHRKPPVPTRHCHHQLNAGVERTGRERALRYSHAEDTGSPRMRGWSLARDQARQPRKLAAL